MAFTELTDKALKTLLKGYDLGTLASFKPVSNGIENSNYFVTTVRPDGSGEHHWVLTILEQPSNAREQLASVLDHCDRAGLPVAAILHSNTGETFSSVAGKPAIFARRLPGYHVFNPTEKQCQALGRFLARMHIAGNGWAEELPAYPRDALWLENTAQQARAHISFTDGRLLTDTVQRLQALLSRGDINELPRGLIHGDLFRDNVLFNENGLSGVLDFHHASFGTLLFDLAVVANDWCSDSHGVLDPDRTMQLLRAYHAIRPLTATEVWFFGTFLLYAGATFWLSRLAAAIASKADSQRRVKNPEEFRDVVRQHTAHSLYLDQRLLEAS
ncbi:MAG: homoserine kinase [Pseudomonadaceae bacterium]|nr:homoserine kinase [Pseudomonadaceae bacterium]